MDARINRRFGLRVVAYRLLNGHLLQKIHDYYAIWYGKSAPVFCEKLGIYLHAFVSARFISSPVNPDIPNWQLRHDIFIYSNSNTIDNNKI